MKCNALWALGLIVSIHGAPPARAQAVSEPVVPILIGQVFDQAGNPVNAEIHFVQANGNVRMWSIRTDVDGRFAADGWLNVPVEVRVTAKGYGSERVEIDRPIRSSQPVVIHLRRSAIVSGSVLDELGLPLAGVRIAVQEVPAQRRWIRTNVTGPVTVSRGDGTFRVEVPAGKEFGLELSKRSCRDVHTDYNTTPDAYEITTPAVIMDCSL
jgi:hypothetical protein